MTNGNMEYHGTTRTQEVVRTIAEGLSDTGSELGQQIQSLIQEGNRRRVVVRDYNKRVLFELPLTAGVVGALAFIFFVPARWLAVSTLAALFTRIYIEIE